MKLLYFDSLFSFGCQRKCGAEILAPIALGLGAFGTMASAVAAEDATDTNINENEKNRRFNSSEAQKARDWQSDELQKSRDFESSQWLSRFGLESEQQMKMAEYTNQLAMQSWYEQQEFNTPAMQVQRMREAGFNPAAIGGQAIYGAGGLSPAPASSPSPSVVSPSPSGSPSASVGLSNPVTANGAEFVGAIGSFISNISKVYNENSKLRPEIDMMLNKIKESQLYQETVKLDNAVKSSQLPTKQKQFYVEMVRLCIQEQAYKDNPELVTADEMLKIQERKESIAKEFLDYMSADKVTTEEQLLCFELVNYPKRFEQDMAESRSRVKANEGSAALGYADAFLKRAQGTTENELRPLRRNLLDAEDDLLRAQKHGQNIDNWIKSESGQAIISSTIEHAKQAGLITKKEAVELSEAMYRYDVRKINSFFDWLGKGISAYRDAGIGTSAFRGFTGNSKSSFDPDAGNSFFMDNESGLLFKAPWSK